MCTALYGIASLSSSCYVEFQRVCNVGVCSLCSTPVGILLISLALCADAVIGNLQEKAMKMHSGSNLEMIFYSYSIGES